jgi:hypothetical protein
MQTIAYIHMAIKEKSPLRRPDSFVILFLKCYLNDFFLIFYGFFYILKTNYITFIIRKIMKLFQSNASLCLWCMSVFARDQIVSWHNFVWRRNAKDVIFLRNYMMQRSFLFRYPLAFNGKYSWNFTEKIMSINIRKNRLCCIWIQLRSFHNYKLQY